MADWFKFYNDALDSKGMQFAIGEQPLVTSVWLVILSEASKNRSCRIKWDDQDFELIGYARKINVSVPVFNQCIGLLTRIGYIVRCAGMLEIPGWNDLQSNYAKALSEGYYNGTKKRLHSKSQVSTTRGEESRREEKRVQTKAPVANAPVEAIPEALNTEAFKVAWVKWHDHLKSKRKPATTHARELQLKKLAAMGETRAVSAILHSIEKNWQGIYEDRNITQATKPSDRNFGVGQDPTKVGADIAAAIEAAGG